MSNENRQYMKDAEDEGLKAVMGSKFQDVSREIPTSPAAPRNDKVRRKPAADPKEYPSHLKTASDIPSHVPDGE